MSKLKLCKTETMQEILKEKLIWFLGGAVVSGLIAGFYHQYALKKKTRLNVLQYIFFDHHGKAVVLTDREISEIMQQYKDGVLLSKIAFAQNLSCAMISRIVGFINRNKNRDIFAPQNQTI